MAIHAFVIGLLTFGLPGCLGALTEPHHANLNQSASVGCSLGNDTDGYLTFYLELNGDKVDRIYTVNQTDMTDTSADTFSTASSNITGDGSSATPYVFTISVTGINTPDLQVIGSGFFASTQGEDVVTVHVMAKSLYDSTFKDAIVFPDDVIYVVSCNFSTITDQQVSSGYLNISGSVTEKPIVLREKAILEIINATSEEVVTNVAVGESIQLQARPELPSLATGTYVHTCRICDNQMCSGAVALSVIDSNGCPVGSYISRLSSGPSLSARTKPFEAFFLSNRKDVYIQCLVNFCYVRAQAECTDYCRATTGGKRKRRDVDQEEPDQLLTVGLKVYTGNDEMLLSVNNQGQEIVDVFAANILNQQAEAKAQKTKESEMMLYAIVVLSVLLVVGLVIASLVFFRLRKRNAKQ